VSSAIYLCIDLPSTGYLDELIEYNIMREIRDVEPVFQPLYGVEGERHNGYMCNQFALL